jgi:hypothetical protein
LQDFTAVVKQLVNYAPAKPKWVQITGIPLSMHYEND